MEDTSIPPHSMGNGQPHQNPVNHTRPFFYVHPPNQQFYYYPQSQWQYNPYAHYGAIPGTGVPFQRPYVAPYPYMTCPPYIMPHAPMQPIDYRRMFNPHPSPGTAFNVRYHQQARAHRETASSETQTESRDAVSKLMVRLDRLQVSEEASEENEQDSGVVSQTSGVFMHSGQGLSHEEQREDPEPEVCPAAEATLGGELSPPSAMPCGLSTATRHVAGSSPGHVGELVRQEVWSVEVDDGVLPLDSSSQYEESEGELITDELVRLPTPEKQHPSTYRSGCPKSHHEGNGEAGIQPVCKPGGPAGPQACGEVTPERLPSTHPAKDDLKPRGDVPSPEKAGVADVQEVSVLVTENLPYRILRLPCNEVTTAGVLPRDGSLWPRDVTPCPATALSPAGYPPSLGDGFLYSYYPPVAPERQSVLSPSLDELSSRDDMFSTDLEDVESVSGTAYVSEGMPTQVAAGASDPGDEDEGGQWEEEECAARETRLCAACGLCLNGDSRRGKSMGMGTWAYRQNNKEGVEEDEVEVDEDCDGYDDEDELSKDAFESWEVPVKKLHCPARHTQPSCVPWQKLKKAYSCEPLDPSGLEEQEQSYPRGPACCDGYKAPNKPDKCKGPNLNGTQSRPRTDKPQGGDRVATGQDNWESCGIKPRQKFWKPYPSRGRVRPAHRRGGYKTFVPQRFRRDYNDDEEEEEFPRFQRGRGSTKRRGARY